MKSVIFAYISKVATKISKSLTGKTRARRIHGIATDDKGPEHKMSNNAVYTTR
jgi:hypothetical protein